jgi:hypothetical protein
LGPDSQSRSADVLERRDRRQGELLALIKTALIRTVFLSSLCKAYRVSNHALREALKRWLDYDVDEMILNCFILCLDEFALGQVTLRRLNAFVGKRSLLSLIQQLEVDCWYLPSLGSIEADIDILLKL